MSNSERSRRARYRLPAGRHRTEIEVVNSRFITTIEPVQSVAEAKARLAEVRAEMPTANHHVYAFRVGYGNSVTEGMSDDGEPSGTSGPPVLAVLRGADIGDTLIVVTRYFGGTKLGTGGLVRAYTEAAQTGLKNLPLVENIPYLTVFLTVPYPLFELVRRLIGAHHGRVESEDFAAEVTLVAVFPDEHVEPFNAALRELSAGRIQAEILDP